MSERPLSLERGLLGLSETGAGIYSMVVLSMLLIVNCKLCMDYPILNMKYMNMHVRSDCIGWNDEFGMILA